MMGGALCGCLPSSQSQMDEQKEMHFLTGKAKVNALDHKGAIEAFERALEANPQNGSAHFELGLLHEKEEDYSAAIYHFERFLKLRPNADHAQLVREKINTDKIELSKTAAFAPVTETLQREFDRLAEENKQLRGEVEKWRAEAEQWRTHYTSQPQGSPRNMAVAAAAQPPSLQPSAPLASSARPASARPAMRTHTVKSGDTLTSIASRYGVKLDALTGANPGLDPRKLKIGQVVNVPMN